MTDRHSRHANTNKLPFLYVTCREHACQAYPGRHLTFCKQRSCAFFGRYPKKAALKSEHYFVVSGSQHETTHLPLDG